MSNNELIDEIQSEVEWLSTSDGDEVECISIENLEGILSRFLNKPIKLTTDEDN